MRMQPLAIGRNEIGAATAVDMEPGKLAALGNHRVDAVDTAAKLHVELDDAGLVDRIADRSQREIVARADRQSSGTVGRKPEPAIDALAQFRAMRVQRGADLVVAAQQQFAELGRSRPRPRVLSISGRQSSVLQLSSRPQPLR